jgi:hypothetical protein
MNFYLSVFCMLKTDSIFEKTYKQKWKLLGKYLLWFLSFFYCIVSSEPESSALSSEIYIHNANTKQQSQTFQIRGQFINAENWTSIIHIIHSMMIKTGKHVY